MDFRKAFALVHPIRLKSSPSPTLSTAGRGASNAPAAPEIDSPLPRVGDRSSRNKQLETARPSAAPSILPQMKGLDLPERERKQRIKNPIGCLLGACSGQHPMGYRSPYSPCCFQEYLKKLNLKSRPSCVDFCKVSRASMPFVLKTRSIHQVNTVGHQEKNSRKEK
jgi:hypothetical protein